jgi:sugar/nucleoside kinase (ribokinase family)
MLVSTRRLALPAKWFAQSRLARASAGRRAPPRVARPTQLARTRWSDQLGAVTLGEDRLVSYHETGKLRHLPALTVPPSQVIDTNGAGDIFHGAYIYSHLSEPDKPWREHFRFARSRQRIQCGFSESEPSCATWPMSRHSSIAIGRMPDPGTRTRC